MHRYAVQVLLAATVLGFLGGCTMSSAINSKYPTSSVIGARPGDLLYSSLKIDELWEADTGKTLHLSELRGKPRVFAMFFTSCQGTCVLTVDYLRQLEASLPIAERSEVGFVLVTFDPGHDTPAALAAYRRLRNLTSDRWTLLRGSGKATADLARHLHLSFNPASARGFVHSNGVTVVDSAGRIVHQQRGLHPDLPSVLAVLKAVTTADGNVANGN